MWFFPLLVTHFGVLKMQIISRLSHKSRGLAFRTFPGLVIKPFCVDVSMIGRGQKPCSIEILSFSFEFSHGRSVRCCFLLLSFHDRCEKQKRRQSRKKSPKRVPWKSVRGMYCKLCHTTYSRIPNKSVYLFQRNHSIHHVRLLLKTSHLSIFTNFSFQYIISTKQT